jgi:DNA-binding transcriptional MerR regulator
MAVAGTSEKSERAFRTISEAAETIGVPQHVLRFWETRFPQLQPLKRGGNRRYYRPSDMALLATIRAMLHDEGLTIRGAQLALGGGKERNRPAARSAETGPTEAVTAAPAMAAAPSAAVATIDIERLRAIRDRLRFALAA